MAWTLNLEFCSKGTVESLKNENSFWVDGAISNILPSLKPLVHESCIMISERKIKLKHKQEFEKLKKLTSRKTWGPTLQNSSSLHSMISAPELLALPWNIFPRSSCWVLVLGLWLQWKLDEEMVDVVAWFGEVFIVGFIEMKLAFHCNGESYHSGFS